MECQIINCDYSTLILVSIVGITCRDCSRARMKPSLLLDPHTAAAASVTFQRSEYDTENFQSPLSAENGC